jgi:transketolase
MRAHFAKLLHEEMKKNDKIIVITADLGYVLWDEIQKDFPDRFINCGAAEQLALGMAVGFALEGYIPIVYSITSFLLLRPAEFIRNYLGHEQINVKLVGSGLDDDYKHLGYSHHFFNVSEYCSWMNIRPYFLLEDFDLFVNSEEPAFLGLRK